MLEREEEEERTGATSTSSVVVDAPWMLSLFHVPEFFFGIGLFIYLFEAAAAAGREEKRGEDNLSYVPSG